MEVFHSSHWGAFVADVHGNSLTAIRPFPKDPDPSPLIYGIPEALDSGIRVRAPAVRRGWLDNGPVRGHAGRGGEPFVEVSWDTALALVSGELSRVVRERGNQSIFGGSYGWSSAGRFHHAKSQLTRFFNCIGGCTGQIGNYSYAAATALLPHVVGSDSATRGGVASWDAIAEHTRLWVMFGGLPLKNSQVESGGAGRHGVRAALRTIREGGVEFVGITPLREDLPEFLDAEWIAPRPNTDSAIMLGIAHTLVTEGRHDEDFLQRYCTGWDRLRAYITGASDGVPKTPEWAAAIADVNAETLRNLARRMARGRTLVTATWSLQRADHGEQPFWMVIALAAMLGQIGLPGGGYGFGYADTAGIGTPTSPITVPALPTGTNPANSAIPVARIADMLLNPGRAYQYNGTEDRYPDIELIYWAGGNPFHHHQDLNRLLAAWQRPATVVVHDVWWTATARHADIVLPATTTLERNDIAASSRDRYIVAMHRAVPARGLARNDHDIFRDLAGSLGVEAAFTEGLDEMGWLRRMYGIFSTAASARGVPVPDFDQFWAAGYIEMPDLGGVVPLSAFRADPRANRLETPSGKIELFSTMIAGFGYPECPGHPIWLEPKEWLGPAHTGEFPLHLISNQPRNRLHSQLGMTRLSRRASVAGREPLRMNPEDAAARDIKEGDLVLVYNHRGRMLAGAHLDAGIRNNVVQVATGAWYDPERPGEIGALDKHGNPNVLTGDRCTSRLGQGPAAHSALVQVTKWDGPVPEVTAFDPPEFEPPGGRGTVS